MRRLIGSGSRDEWPLQSLCHPSPSQIRPPTSGKIARPIDDTSSSFPHSSAWGGSLSIRHLLPLILVHGFAKGACCLRRRRYCDLKHWVNLHKMCEIDEVRRSCTNNFSGSCVEVSISFSRLKQRRGSRDVRGIACVSFRVISVDKDI